MVTPARQLLFAIPLGLQAVGSFERIQKFLQLEDKPILMATSSSNDPEETQIREKSPELDSKLPFQGSRHAPAIHAKNVAFGWLHLQLFLFGISASREIRLQQSLDR